MNNNFIQVLETADKEKRKMYSRCTKKELISMLIECNKIIDRIDSPEYIVFYGDAFKAAQEGGFTCKYVNDEIIPDLKQENH
jgi:hypothetical protein